jgi:hypothetical protein
VEAQRARDFDAEWPVSAYSYYTTGRKPEKAQGDTGAQFPTNTVGVEPALK